MGLGFAWAQCQAWTGLSTVALTDQGFQLLTNILYNFKREDIPLGIPDFHIFPMESPMKPLQYLWGLSYHHPGPWCVWKEGLSSSS